MQARHAVHDFLHRLISHAGVTPEVRREAGKLLVAAANEAVAQQAADPRFEQFNQAVGNVITAIGDLHKRVSALEPEQPAAVPTSNPEPVVPRTPGPNTTPDNAPAGPRPVNTATEGDAD